MVLEKESAVASPIAKLRVVDRVPDGIHSRFVRLHEFVDPLPYASDNWPFTFESL